MFWVSYQTGLKIYVGRFSKGAIKYEIDINKTHNTFAIYEVIDNDYSHLRGLINGNTRVANGTIYLLELKSIHRVFIYNNKLVGYPSLRDTIILKDE